ncbi:MAG TPA: hypothetical protein VHS56_13805 [Candidatus Cybelea sp.]|jgi:hypothetical protein|nr:hypothetical protein [Candidatus Cybelea sp.]
MQVRGDALMHYIDTTTQQQVVEATSPPAGAHVNPANACGVCCDVVGGMPTNWRCMQCSCTGTCTLQTEDLGDGQTLYYCTCS